MNGVTRLAVGSLLTLVSSGSCDLAFSAVTSAPMQCEPACPSLLLAKPQAGESVKGLNFHRILASRPGDQRAYVLLGSGFFRAFSFGDPGKFVADWLSRYPLATYSVVSTDVSTNRRTQDKMEIDYIWVESGGEALNVDLVRKGIFQGATMFDMVDNARGLDRLLRTDPSLSEARLSIEKERASYPEDRAERHIFENDYKARMLRVEEAQKSARAEKLGIWSDEMKDEREAEGVS